MLNKSSLKAVILTGGMGTRLSEETSLRPKPMVEIGGKPILWHIMKMYSYYGINEFILCLGYKGYVIKEYFANYYLHMSNVTFDMVKNETQIHHNRAEPWRVTLVDTGDNTMTGGRLKRVKEFVGNEDFCFTYGDGVADVNIKELIKYHRTHGRTATVTAVRPPGRYGSLGMSGQMVSRFEEKPIGDGSWINGGFFVLSPNVFDYIDGDSTTWESTPLERLVEKNQLAAFQHHGFWLPMDTMRDKNHLESLWVNGKAPWKVW